MSDEPATKALVDPKKYDGIRNMIADLKERVVDNASTQEDADAFVLGIMNDILTVETEDEIFEVAESASVSGKDFVARPFRLLDSDLTFSKARTEFIQAGGFPFFARMDVTEIATGQTITIATGAKTAVAILYALQSRGFLKQYDDEGGKPLVFVEIPTASGNAAIRLAPYKVAPVGKSKKV